MLRRRGTRLLLFVAVLAAASASAALGVTSRAAAGSPAAIQHAPRRLQASAAPRVLAHATSGRSRSEPSFRWPAQGTITTPFVRSGPGHHDGIDIGSLRSSAIVAARAGRVLHVGYTTGFEGYGNIVDVEVAPGVETLYAHLSAMDVKVGDEVAAGRRLGIAGCTGICSGEHLHFEVRVDGTPVDPLRYLP